MPVAFPLQSYITAAKRNLDEARETGDELLIDLAENALNSLLDAYQTDQTQQEKKQ